MTNQEVAVKNILIPFFFMIFMNISSFAGDASWVSIQQSGKNFTFPNQQIKIPVGYNDVVIGYGLQFLVPDRENYNPTLTYEYLDNIDAHNVSVIRIFMENPMRETYTSTGGPYYFNPFWMEDRPGSFEDSSHWSLDQNPGYLRIITQAGDTWIQGSTAKNLLLRYIDPPEMENFSVETKVTFVPQGNYDCASLYIYQDKDNYVRLSRHPEGIEYCREIEGGIQGYAISSCTNETVFLRISKEGSTYIGEFSLDGNSYNEVARFTGLKSLIRPEANVHFTETYLRTGITAFSTEDRSINADFDSFRIRQYDGTVIFEDDFNGAMDDDWTWMSYYPASIKFWDDLISYVTDHTANIYLMLTPWDPYFSFRNEHGHWDHSIYRSANGGYCNNKIDFFNDPRMVNYEITHYKYIINRWGNSPRIFAWELLNEAENQQFWPGVDAVILQNWISQVLQPLKNYEYSLYGKNHLWTISSAKAGPDGDLGDVFFRSPDFDFSTTHFYTCCSSDPISCNYLPCRISSPGSDYIGPALNVECGMKNALNQISDNRPFFESESGPIAQNIEDESLDVEYHHNMIWAHFASGGSGSGLRWLHRANLCDGFLNNYKALQDLAQYIDWTNFISSNYSDYISASNYDENQLHVMSCSDGNQAIVWLLKDSSVSQPIQAQILCSHFEPREHQIQWFNDWDGSPIGVPTQIPQNSEFSIESPEFEKSVTAIITSSGYRLPLSYSAFLIPLIVFSIIFLFRPSR